MYGSIEYEALYLIVKNKYRITLLRGLKMGIYVQNQKYRFIDFLRKQNFLEKTVIIFVISALELTIVQVLGQVAKKVENY